MARDRKEGCGEAQNEDNSYIKGQSRSQGSCGRRAEVLVSQLQYQGICRLGCKRPACKGKHMDRWKNGEVKTSKRLVARGVQKDDTSGSGQNVRSGQGM